VQPYRIVLADDHLIFRELIKKSLQEIPDLEIVGEAADGLELLDCLQKLEPRANLIILDIEMPHLSGIESAKEIKETSPDIKILILTMHKSKNHLQAAINAKVDGYLLKEDAFQDLIAAIEMVRQGGMYFSNLTTKTMVEFLIPKKTPRPESDPLSAREIEVVKYFATGKPTEEIATLLSITESTVRNHLAKIRKKLSFRKNIELAKYAFKKGYIP